MQVSRLSDSAANMLVQISYVAHRITTLQIQLNELSQPSAAILSIESLGSCVPPGKMFAKSLRNDVRRRVAVNDVRHNKSKLNTDSPGPDFAAPTIPIIASNVEPVLSSEVPIAPVPESGELRLEPLLSTVTSLEQAKYLVGYLSQQVQCFHWTISNTFHKIRALHNVNDL